MCPIWIANLCLSGKVFPSVNRSLLLLLDGHSRGLFVVSNAKEAQKVRSLSYTVQIGVWPWLGSWLTNRPIWLGIQVLLAEGLSCENKTFVCPKNTKSVSKQSNIVLLTHFWQLLWPIGHVPLFLGIICSLQSASIGERAPHLHDAQ